MSSSPSSSPTSTPSPVDDNDDMINLYVKAWSKSELPLRLTANQRAQWTFKTKQHDIQFACDFIPKNKSATEDDDENEEDDNEEDVKAESSSSSSASSNTATIAVVSMSRIAADTVLTTGSFTAPQAGILILRFDNTYSKLRGKNLLYKIVVSSSSSATCASETHASLPAVALGSEVITSFGPATVGGIL